MTGFSLLIGKDFKECSTGTDKTRAIEWEQIILIYPIEGCGSYSPTHLKLHGAQSTHRSFAQIHTLTANTVKITTLQQINKKTHTNDKIHRETKMGN